MGGVFMIALWIILGRYWEVDLFGYFNYLFAYISIVGIFFDFGLDVLLTKHLSKCISQKISKKNPAAIPKTCWQLKKTVFLIVIILSSITGYFLSFPIDSLLCLLTGITLLSFTSYFNAIFRARDQLHIEAKIGLLQKTIFIGASIIGVVNFEQEILWLSIAYLISHLFALILTLIIIKKSQWLKITANQYSTQDYLHQSWPLFVTALLAILSLRLDVFLLQWLKSPEQVGYYTAAMRLFEGITIVSTAFIAVIFPKFVAKSHNLPELMAFFKHTARILSGAALTIIIPGLFIIPTAIITLYGDKFSPSIILLQTLLPALLIVFLTSLSGNLLIAMGKQHKYMQILSIILVTQTLVNIVSIYFWGTIGAVIGFWIKEVLLIIMLFNCRSKN
jgi:O-antigen/teichoic acid export membrane protein